MLPGRREPVFYEYQHRKKQYFFYNEEHWPQLKNQNHKSLYDGHPDKVEQLVPAYLTNIHPEKPQARTHMAKQTLFLLFNYGFHRVYPDYFATDFY
jgi:hypothetical protein